MDKLLVSLQTADFVKLLFDEIFHSLHVVVGHRLDFLHATGISLRESDVNVAQTPEQCMVETYQLRQRQLAQSDEVLDFHAYPVTDKRIF